MGHEEVGMKLSSVGDETEVAARRGSRPAWTHGEEVRGKFLACSRAGGSKVLNVSD